MAKKSRRVRRKGTRARLSKAQLVQPTKQKTPQAVEAPVVADARSPSEPAQRSAVLDFAEEYHYVVSDLQKIGVLAAVILGVLVILSLIL